MAHSFEDGVLPLHNCSPATGRLPCLQMSIGLLPIQQMHTDFLVNTVFIPLR